MKNDDAPQITIMKEADTLVNQVLHQAGYDARLTGEVFVALLQKSDDRNVVQKTLRNQVFLMKSPTSLDINDPTARPTTLQELRTIHAEFDEKISTKDLKDSFGQDVRVTWLTDTTAYITAAQPTSAASSTSNQTTQSAKDDASDALRTLNIEAARALVTAADQTKFKVAMLSEMRSKIDAENVFDAINGYSVDLTQTSNNGDDQTDKTVVAKSLKRSLWAHQSQIKISLFFNFYLLPFNVLKFL